MSDRPVRTRILTEDGWHGFQEFMIIRGARGPVLDVEFRHARAAPPTPEVLAAVDSAQAIIIGPSNPVLSVAPILALPGLRDRMKAAPGPVVAVSPLVAGQVIKGPTDAFMQWAEQPLSSDGIAAVYDGLIDGLVADEPTALLPQLQTDLLMDGPAARTRLAEETLQFAMTLR
jgi:LPPG:FO 2-phospho-L-lactate transferase